MDILKAATDWTKAEVFSSTFFIGFGVFFVLASIGFWHLGKTDTSRAYITPTLVAGILLLIIGLGLFAQSYMRVSSFATAFNADAPAFIASEIARADKVMNEYRIAVVWFVPIIVAVCAGLIMFIDSPTWRAVLITTIAMMSVILFVDTNANARLEAYREQLALAETSG